MMLDASVDLRFAARVCGGPTMKLRTISFITSALVTLIGLGSLAGYALDAPMLIEGLAGYLLMNPMTAICFIMLSVGAHLLSQNAAGLDQPGRQRTQVHQAG